MEIETHEESKELGHINENLRRLREYRWVLDEKMEECSSKEDHVKLQGLKSWVEREILKSKNRLTEIYKNVIAKKGSVSGTVKIFE